MTWLALAAALLFILGVGHSYLGERYILMRLFREERLPRLFGTDVFTRRTLRFAWHITTIAWWGAAVALLALGHGDVRGALNALAAAFFVSGTIALVASRGRHLSWIVFYVIAIAVLLGKPAS